MNVASLAITLLVSFVVLVESNNTLIFTQVLFRHGARAPSLGLTNDSYSKHFHRGLGELTDRGFENSYKLGKFLRRRYVDTGFLDKDLLPKEMYWRSVNKRRCLSTAATVGASMFETPGKYLQVAVFTDENGENLLSYDQAECPREEQLVKQTCPHFNGIYEPWPKYEEFIANCLNYTHPVFEKYPFHTIEAHMNEYKNGIPLPPLLSENINEIMKIYVNVTQFITGTGHHHNRKVMKMKFGYLMDTLMENLRKFNSVNQTEPRRRPPKFVAYSTQDWILMGVLDSFGVLQKSVGLEKYPEYNSMIIIELWKTESGELVVKMFYKAEEETYRDHTLIDLTDSVRNCKGFKDGCPLDNFFGCCYDYTHHAPVEMCKLGVVDDAVSTTTPLPILPNALFGDIGSIKKRKRRFAGPE